jgi:NAD(P)-dependent dehydrogenase (short-subunit alcohol dehydrogenase family)
MGRLAGKIAFISATRAGIGRGAAQVFAAEGAKVFGCDINPPEADAETVALVEKAGGVMTSLALRLRAIRLPGRLGHFGVHPDVVAGIRRA